MSERGTGNPVFESVLVANRGEIAVRVVRTLRAMGIRPVTVFTAADATHPHASLGEPSLAISSYLAIDEVLAAAERAGAQAIHPGYGFLSENAAFAAACMERGIVFVGPPVAAIEAMGDKIAAKAAVAAAGVRVVPGSSGDSLGDDQLVAAAVQVGFPVILKPSAGGGGKGMVVVHEASDLPEAIASARRIGRGSFGDDRLLVERFVANPRHIEIQVLADAHGNVVHFGERECSLQRRHQKIVEEAPSPLLDDRLRAAMGEQAIAAARSCGYVGAGTVEFIVSGERPDDAFFMEMNTRLQVEHPVTELVYGVDLVELQLKVAAGEPLPVSQGEVVANGHAVEARLYAEDPDRGFLPTGGTVFDVVWPSGDGVRVDAGIASRTVVGSNYDPMLAKLIAWGADRGEALARLDAALASTAVLGVTTNAPFLRRLLTDADVAAGRLDTGLVERNLDALVGATVPDAALIAVALSWWTSLAQGACASDPFAGLAGWRLGGVASSDLVVDVPWRGATTLGVVPASGSPQVSIDGCDVGVDDVDAARQVVVGRADAGPEAAWLVAVEGGSWTISVHRRSAGAGGGPASDGVVRSPMPGTVISVDVAVGDEVTAGQRVVVCEAMKMEHALVAPHDGTVAEIRVAVGAKVELDAVLVVIA